MMGRVSTLRCRPVWQYPLSILSIPSRLTGRPSQLALVKGTGSVAEEGGGTSGISAPIRSTSPPQWLAVVGGCSDRAGRRCPPPVEHAPFTDEVLGPLQVIRRPSTTASGDQ